MRVLKTFVAPDDLTVYRQGEEYPRAGATPAPGVLARLTADGMIESDTPAPKPAAETAPAPTARKSTKTTRRR